MLVQQLNDETKEKATGRDPQTPPARAHKLTHLFALALQGAAAATLFLSIAADSADDMSGNGLAAIDGQEIGPVLQFATVSMADGAEQIVAIFSEAVAIATFDATGLTFLNAESSSA